MLRFAQMQAARHFAGRAEYRGAFMMAQYKLAFLGTGNMGGALVAAAASGGHGAECILSNRTRQKAQALAQQYGCAVADTNVQAAQQAQYIMLGVKPQMMAGLLAEIAPVLQKRQAEADSFCLVSMAAGLSVARLAEMAGLECPIVRIMPNTPCAIGKGMTLVVKNECASEEQAQEVCDLLAAAGEFDRIDESLMDAGSVISGCVGAWVQMFMEGLADGAVEAGIPRAKAQKYAAGAVLGAAALALESGRHPGQLKDEVCSPAGSTIAGVHALERAGLRGAAMDAVAAAFARTKEMGKK